MSTIASVPALHAFSIRREDAGRVPVLVVTGSIDADTAPQLSAAVCAFGSEKVVVDLQGVAHVSAWGLRDLLLASRLCAVRLHVVCPAAGPGRAQLEASGLPVHGSRADALARSPR